MARAECIHRCPVHAKGALLKVQEVGQRRKRVASSLLRMGHSAYPGCIHGLVSVVLYNQSRPCTFSSPFRERSSGPTVAKPSEHRSALAKHRAMFRTVLDGARIARTHMAICQLRCTVRSRAITEIGPMHVDVLTPHVDCHKQVQRN